MKEPYLTILLFFSVAAGMCAGSATLMMTDKLTVAALVGIAVLLLGCITVFSADAVRKTLQEPEEPEQ